MRSLSAVGVLGLGLLLVLAAGCSPKKVLQPNVPPTTRLFVQFDPADGVSHATNHVAHLYWFGSDPDGYVVGYDIRFIWPGGPANPPWSRTTETDSVFVIPDTTGQSTPTFEVRAVDDGGLVDPAPRRQAFDFRNDAPVVTFVDPPVAAESTYASQTISWTGVDPDGDAALLSYRVWLDGNEASPHEMRETDFTFPTSDFLQSGKLRSGYRIANVQAIDAGGRLSTVATAQWYVRAPVPDSTQRARLLLIDDIDVDAPGSASRNYRNFYTNAITRSAIPAGSWAVLQLDRGRPPRSTKDLEQTLELFDAVVWYRGPGGYPSPSAFFTPGDTLLHDHSDAIAAYLDHGGKFYLEALDMVEVLPTRGLLGLEFVRQHLDCNQVMRRFLDGDSTASWGVSKSYTDIVNGVPVSHPAILRSTLLADSLKMNGGFDGLRVFGVRDSNNVVLWARDSVLTERQEFDAPIAVRAISGSSQAIVTTVPLVPAGGFAGSTNRFIDKVFDRLGIKP